MKESFEKFVSEYAREFGYVEINHCRWSYCAVGVFAESIGVCYTRVVSELYKAYGSVDYGKEEYTIMDILNWNGLCKDGKKVIDTWGDLDRCIRLGV